MIVAVLSFPVRTIGGKFATINVSVDDSDTCLFPATGQDWSNILHAIGVETMSDVNPTLTTDPEVNHVSALNRLTPFGLSIDSDAQEIVSVMYTTLLTNWLDGVSDATKQMAASATGRDPVQEEKIRLIIISACTLWMYLSRNPSTQAFLSRVIAACSDPTTWNTLATIFWGPA